MRADAAVRPRNDEVLAAAPGGEAQADAAGDADALGSAADPDGDRSGSGWQPTPPHLGRGVVRDPPLRARPSRLPRRAAAVPRARARLPPLRDARGDVVRGGDALPGAVGLRARTACRSCRRQLPRAACERGAVERVNPVRAAVERELPERAFASRTTHLAGERAVR